MKKIIFALVSLISAAFAHAGPWDYTLGQYDQFGVSPIPRLIILPSGGASGIFIHNGSTNLPMLATVDTSLSISSGGVISVNAANFATVTALNGKFDSPTGTTAQYLRGDGTLATFPTIPASQIQADWAQASSGALDYIKNKPSLATVATSGAYADLTGKPSLATVATSGSYTDLTNKPTIPPAITLTTTGSGAATYNTGTGALNIPTPTASGTVTSITAGTGLSGGTIITSGTISMPNIGTAGTYNQVTTDAQGRVTAGANVKFDFSQPTSRTLAVSTSYQALDNTKAAVIIPSYSCQNATTVLAASGCTIQVRMGTGTLTCSTGTVYYTQSLTVALGVLITQNSINPVPINLPIGASFILCATAGTFTITTVEQSAG